LSWILDPACSDHGDRRDHYEAETDIWEVAARIAAGRKGARDRSRRDALRRLRGGRRRRSTIQPVASKR